LENIRPPHNLGIPARGNDIRGQIWRPFLGMLDVEENTFNAQEWPFYN